MIFASTPPINDDPEPYHCSELNPGTFTVRMSSPAEWCDLDIYDPRPERDRPRAHEANSVLIAFRKYAAQKDVVPQYAVDFWLFGIEAFEVFGGYERWDTPTHMFHSLTTAMAAEIDHAKRVLNRLTVKS